MSDDTHPLRRYLAAGFEALRWKLDGLSEYDLRRPLVPSGTNLLGIAKHIALVTAGYFGPVFGRPTVLDELMSQFESAEPNADMWATADESSEYILGLLDTAATEVDAAMAELPLDAPGRVPWWGDQGDVTLERVAVHVVAELHRHTGQADIVRELIDGTVGLNGRNDNLPEADAAWWEAYRDRLQAVAESFRRS